MAVSRRPARARAALGLLTAWALVACSEPRDPGPPGAWWVGHGDAVRDVLGQLGGLEGTPVAGAVPQLQAVLPSCDVIGGTAATTDFAQLVLETHCIGSDDPLARELERARADVAFALPVAGHARLRGALRRTAEALVMEISWPQPEARGALALLLPGDGPAGPQRLGDRGSFAHVRMRPQAGIDLAAWMPAEGGKERLYAFVVGLFDGLVLDGTWEGAAYLPERPGELPGLALALGYRARGPAVVVAERLLSDLRQTLGVERRELPPGLDDGACLSPLPGLPELAPCYVAAGDALVVAGNPATLRRALAPGRGRLPSGAAGRLDVDLDALGGVELRRESWRAAAVAPTRWPWRRLRATGDARRGVLSGRLTLELRERRAS